MRGTGTGKTEGTAGVYFVRPEGREETVQIRKLLAGTRCRGPFALALIGLSLLIAVPPASADYGWILSGSSINPFQAITAPFLGDRDVYLWMWCNSLGGATSAAMDVTGTLEVVSFAPLNGVVQSGTLPTLDLVFPGCMFDLAGSLVGVLTVRDSTGLGGEVCFAGMPVTRDCAVPPADHEHLWVGMNTAGSSPCKGGTSCPVDLVDPQTWGRVKSRYAE